MRSRRRRWVACAPLPIVLGASMVTGGPAVEPAPSRVVEIDYDVIESALPLDSVELWVTDDRGQTWRMAGTDEDRQSPIVFHAPVEGLFGLFLVVRNATGPSSAPPMANAEPHRWVFVDETPPVVQLHAPRQTLVLGERVLQVRWTAVDANLSPRPIHIDFQRAGADAWRPVVPDAIANTGRFDWRLPDDLVGSVALRVSVTDQGGHRVDSEARRIETTPTTAVPPPSEPAPFSSTAPSAPPAALPGSVRSRKLAEQAYVEAVAFRRRGDLRRGVSRMRDVLRYDPQRTDVFAEMADMLYELNDLDRALNAYDLALRQDPTQRSALLGSARVLSRRRDYGPAAERLRTLLRYNPNDAAAWMGLGDVAVYQGDELLARECYTRATQIDPGANEVIRDARKRLAMMAEVSRSYHPSDR